MRPEIKNLKKAASRILKAIKSKEKIILYGDADLDGVASVIILAEAIKNLGGENRAIYFPDREKEGYGISEKALHYFKKEAPALLLTLDCGIGNFKEVKLAKELGFEAIIIDHHEVLDKLPGASIIIDPKQKGDRYPFKHFATVGLVFKLSEVLLKKQMPESLRKDFLELVALATIADMMPRTDENEIMIREGLSSLESSWRPGIQALFELEPLRSLNLIQRVSKTNSLLNVRDVQNQLPAAFRLLTSSNKAEARKLAERLFEKGLQRRERIKEITEEVERKIFGKEVSPIIFEGDSEWELALLGVVASILSQKYKKPVFLFKKGEAESQGGIRAPSGFDLVEAMKSCSKNLITYGGHPQAAGFRIKNEHLEDFKNCLIEHFNNL
jgi:single-stranded-DNA-specific exonuclease